MSHLKKLEEILEKDTTFETYRAAKLFVAKTIYKQYCDACDLLADKPSEKELQVDQYFTSWSLFFAEKVDPDDWSELRVAGLKFLLKFIRSDKEKYKQMPEHKEFSKLYLETYDTIVHSGKYSPEEIQGWHVMGK